MNTPLLDVRDRRTVVTTRDGPMPAVNGPKPDRPTDTSP